MANATELCSNWLDSYFRERPQMKAPPMGVFGYEMPEWTAAVIQKLLSEKLGLIEECSEIREKLAAMESQEPVYFWKEIGETDWMECHKDWYLKCVDSPEHDTKLLYAKPVPADNPARITEQDAREIIEAVAHIGVDFGYGAFEIQPEMIAKCRALLNKLNEDREQVPAVAVPDKLTYSADDYPKEERTQMHGYINGFNDCVDAMIATAPSRSPQHYAIEHAEYMAVSGEQLMDYLNEIANEDDGVLVPDDRFGDYIGGLRSGVYEFRKRRDRCSSHESEQGGTV